MVSSFKKSKSSLSLLSVYNKKDGSFDYKSDMLEHFGVELNGSELWKFLEEKAIISEPEATELRLAAESLDDKKCTFFKMCTSSDHGTHAFSLVNIGESVTVAISRISSELEPKKLDELTGLSVRNDFCNEIASICREDPNGDYALFFFDIIKFKAINDIFGFTEGDDLIIHISKILTSEDMPIIAACRESADRFLFLANTKSNSAEKIADMLINKIKIYELPFEISVNIGIYLIKDKNESGESMLDKAMLAQTAIKGSYTESINFYNEALRDDMLSEQEISGAMNTALAEEQFLIYYQPQYNHSTGMIIGAEALVRWEHPEKGLISPGRFIPIFEKNGFISKLDFYVFEHVARFIKKSIDNNFSIVPISINFSKNDIFFPNFVDIIESIRKKYDVPAKYMRIEITESILIGNNKAVNEILKKLHSCGYVIEMDDFGSGYSSLNVLKDLEFDIIKLDMLFLSDKDENGRGGTILSSVVNMAKWLNIPIIAEGVETISQADFLRSIGCDYIQGYLYSRPLPEKDYEALVSASKIGALIPQMNIIDTLNSTNFWNPTSQETLIFSNFVGAAVIFSYDRNTKNVDILRVNKKYLRELGMNLSERDIIHGNPSDTLNEINKAVYFNTLDKAIETGEEQECETWREIRSACCGEENICIRSTVTVIGKSDNQFLFYGMIRNITSEKNTLTSMLDNEKRFKAASEQVNIYFWEYTVATKEMRPCFRCMRDLGLPPLLRNYPDSAIERGIFPPEVADMYRDWHVQVANGVKELEAVIPLTHDRIPFRVRYTTEFDENGHPIKAYGSAALIVE